MKKSFASILGKFTASVMLIGLSTCIIAVVATITFIFVRWMLTLGGII